MVWVRLHSSYVTRSGIGGDLGPHNDVGAFALLSCDSLENWSRSQHFSLGKYLFYLHFDLMFFPHHAVILDVACSFEHHP
jgi:hypothetical protein